jgi:hypothetical protein
LQPIAGVINIVGHHFDISQHGGIPFREIRPLFRWTHVGKNQAKVFHDRIRAVAHLLAEFRILRGCFQDGPIYIIEPSVITTSKTLVFDNAKFEGSIPMTTVEMEQAQCSLLVPEYHEVFSEDTDAKRNVADLTGECNRNPESPEIFSTRRTGIYVGELAVFNRPLRLVISAKTGLNSVLIGSCFFNVGALWQIV